jgi:hypothetical protein
MAKDAKKNLIIDGSKTFSIWYRTPSFEQKYVVQSCEGNIKPLLESLKAFNS